MGMVHGQMYRKADIKDFWACIYRITDSIKYPYRISDIGKPIITLQTETEVITHVRYASRRLSMPCKKLPHQRREYREIKRIQKVAR